MKSSFIKLALLLATVFYVNANVVLTEEDTTEMSSENKVTEKLMMKTVSTKTLPTKTLPSYKYTSVLFRTNEDGLEVYNNWYNDEIRVPTDVEDVAVLCETKPEYREIIQSERPICDYDMNCFSFYKKFLPDYPGYFHIYYPHRVNECALYIRKKGATPPSESEYKTQIDICKGTEVDTVITHYHTFSYEPITNYDDGKTITSEFINHATAEYTSTKTNICAPYTNAVPDVTTVVTTTTSPIPTHLKTMSVNYIVKMDNYDSSPINRDKILVPTEVKSVYMECTSTIPPPLKRSLPTEVPLQKRREYESDDFYTLGEWKEDETLCDVSGECFKFYTTLESKYKTCGVYTQKSDEVPTPTDNVTTRTLCLPTQFDYKVHTKSVFVPPSQVTVVTEGDVYHSYYTNYYTRTTSTESYQLCTPYIIMNPYNTETTTKTTKAIPITASTTTTTKTTKTIPLSTSITKTTKTLPTTKCIPVTVTITEKEDITITEKETVTVTVSSKSTQDVKDDDDSKCARKWAQCGGTGYMGPTCCESGSTCRKINMYYSQCI